MRPAFAGPYLERGEPGFEQAAVGRVFNGRRPADRRPEAVLLAADETDVQAGVRYAAERGWQVAVRSGGHSWAAWSLRNGTLLIDLAALNDIRYDAETGIVAAGPAVKGGDELSPFLEERGRFFGGGHCPSVGIGGFLLQGGGAGTPAAGAGPPSRSPPSTWSPPTANWCGPTRTRTRTSTGRLGARVPRSRAS